MIWITLLSVLLSLSLQRMWLYRRRWLNAEAILNSSSHHCHIFRDANGITVYVDNGPDYTTFDGIDPIYSSWFDGKGKK